MSKSRWQKLSLAEQMGNIASEVNRALYWRECGDNKNTEKATERALELIDLTITDKRWHSRLKEIIRFREVLCDYFWNSLNYNVSSRAIKNYLLPFALRARSFDS